MTELGPEQDHFMRHWFAGLVEGLEAVDDRAQDAILSACGQACARSYTGELFRAAWQASHDLESFLAQLGGRFPEATYQALDGNTVEVHYARCGCDLVQNGWVSSPILCRCSAHNLRANFEGAVAKPVTVTMKSSILAGAASCVFQVVLAE